MVASENKRKSIAEPHIGTMGWSYTFWVGNFYPDGLKPKQFLAEYSKRFDSVEVDNTFYKIPSTNTVKAWKEQTPEGFLFSAKFPRLITHVKMLQNCEKEVDRFISSVSHLENKLGPILLQFPSFFGPKHFPRLQDFIPSLPTSHRYAVEVRNSNLLQEKTYSLLRENGVALVLVDQLNAPLVEEVTADFVYIKWEGDRGKVSGTLGKIEVDRTENTRKWADRAKNLLDQQIEVFGYFSKYYSGYPPRDAEQLLKLLSS